LLYACVSVEVAHPAPDTKIYIRWVKAHAKASGSSSSSEQQRAAAEEPILMNRLVDNNNKKSRVLGPFKSGAGFHQCTETRPVMGPIKNTLSIGSRIPRVWLS